MAMPIKYAKPEVPAGSTITTARVVVSLHNDNTWEPVVELGRIYDASTKHTTLIVAEARYYNDFDELVSIGLGDEIAVARFDDPHGEYTQWFVGLVPGKWVDVSRLNWMESSRLILTPIAV